LDELKKGVLLHSRFNTGIVLKKQKKQDFFWQKEKIDYLCSPFRLKKEAKAKYKFFEILK
jgi:hypothetical protein